MIPKIIHYCWFGRGEKNELISKCMQTWKTYCPEYKIIEWNEDNFNIDSNEYVKEAYENRKWAFVSDYARLYALSTVGGFYLDTDVELVKSLDDFLIYSAVLGYESKECILTAFIGAEANNEWINEMLSYYEGRHFVGKNGVPDITTNVVTISELSKNKYGIPFDDKIYDVPGILTIFPREYFSPKSPGSKSYRLTENTTAIHHFDASWMDGNRRINQLKMRHGKLLTVMKKVICAIIGKKKFEKMRGR